MRQRSRLNSCQGKQRYGAWWRAQRDAKRMNTKHDETLMVYRCSICGGFHLGHVDPRWKERRPRDA